MMNKAILVLFSLFLMPLCSCTTSTYTHTHTNTTTRVDNTAGRPTVYEDPGNTGSVAGVGIESQDVVSMTDRMMRDILATPSIAGRQSPPLVIIDDNYFVNDSSSVINKKLITERLMVSLNRSSQGRIIFIDRNSIGMVQKERELKRTGVVSGGTLSQTVAVAGADFRLTGRIMSLDKAEPGSGKVSRYTQIVFKLIDLETAIPVWANMYEFKKFAQDDIIYR